VVEAERRPGCCDLRKTYMCVPLFYTPHCIVYIVLSFPIVHPFLVLVVSANSSSSSSSSSSSIIVVVVVMLQCDGGGGLGYVLG